MISIIIPVYNTEKYLVRCINSALNQTYKNTEIVLVDDGSTDNSGLICDEMARNNSSIRVIHQANRGLVRARKTGLENSKGEFIYPLDSDDYIEEMAIEKMAEAQGAEDVDIVLSGARILDQCGSLMTEIKEKHAPKTFDMQDYESSIYNEVFVNGNGSFTSGIRCNLWSRLYRRSVLYEAQMAVDDEIVNGEDDVCFYGALLNAAKKICFEGGCYYNVFSREESMSRNSRCHSLSGLGLLEEALFSIIKDHPAEKKLRPQLEKYIFMRFNIYAARKGYSNYLRPVAFFPFHEITAKSKIIIYGAGKIGDIYLQQLKEITVYNLVAVCDKRNGEEICGHRIISLKAASALDFDYIVLASSNENTLKEMKKDVLEYIAEDKIICTVPSYSKNWMCFR